jgi:hypothetical protein
MFASGLDSAISFFRNHNNIGGTHLSQSVRRTNDPSGSNERQAAEPN